MIALKLDGEFIGEYRTLAEAELAIAKEIRLGRAIGLTHTRFSTEVETEQN